jgi:hypothetical protein
MDPIAMQKLVMYLVPMVAILATFGTPVAIIWLVKHFNLRHRELDLEAQLHGKELELRLKTLEVRQAAIETALTAIGAKSMEYAAASSLEQRVSLLEAPATSAESEDASQTADPLRLRSR